MSTESLLQLLERKVLEAQRSMADQMTCAIFGDTREFMYGLRTTPLNNIYSGYEVIEIPNNRPLGGLLRSSNSFWNTGKEDVYKDNYPIEVGCEQVRYPTVREKLEQQKNELTERLSKVQAAIDALDQNPGVANVLEILGKAGY